MVTETLDLHASGSAIARPTVAPRQLQWPNWLKEPLVHFIIAGGVLFAIDHAVSSRSGDPHQIVMSMQDDRDARETFKASSGREPNPAELAALRHVWLDNEVLYREGLALGVDKGDPAIRERVIFKALSVVDSNVKLPAPDDKTLRAWFEAHRNKYDDPARFDFEEAALSGANSEQAVRDFVQQLNGGTPGDAKAGLRVFKARPLANLVDSYGADFASALQRATPGVWQAMSTREGWRAIKLNAAIAPRPGVFEALRGVVTQDWKDEIASEQRSAAVRALSKKYKIRYEADAK